jgi:hypothetical protein
MTTPPPGIEEWRKWLEVINREIVVLHHNRRLFSEIMQMIRAHPTLPQNSVVYDWIIRQYVVSATMGVRRQADTMTNVVSMARLLEQIECHAPLITRDWFVTQYGRLNNVADRDFNEFAAPGASAVDPRVVQVDRESLRRTTRDVRRWANKYVAHLDKKVHLGQSSKRPRLTWRKLDAAIDVLGKLLRKYELLLNQRDMVTVEPVIAENWKKVFTVPWLPPAGGGENQ